MRFIIEAEVEVVDATAAAAYIMDWGYTEDGGVAMLPADSEEDQMFSAIRQAMLGALNESIGVRFISGSGIRRTVVDGEHPPLTFPGFPARREDGSIPELDHPDE